MIAEAETMEEVPDCPAEAPSEGGAQQRGVQFLINQKTTHAWRSVPTEQWNDWRWQVSNRIIRLEGLERVIRLTSREVGAIRSCQRVFPMAITPYFASHLNPTHPGCPLNYLYQCDPAMGLDHFKTPISRGIEIIRALRGFTTGYAVPAYVIDAPGGGREDTRGTELCRGLCRGAYDPQELSWRSLSL